MQASAGSFSARVSPPHFELKADPGEVLRQAIAIGNEDEEEAHYQIRTADWSLNDKGGVTIVPADQPLVPTSCRSWTRIERRSVKLAAGAVMQYRFEVHVPDDAQDGQCRFAIVIAPHPDSLKPMQFGDIQVPVAGAIAVIVYVTVGDAKPVLELKGVIKDTVRGKQGPALRFLNNGNAHARPFGSVRIEDATGRKAELVVSPFPILPGRTFDINLMVDPTLTRIDALEEMAFPLHLKGLIEWDGGSLRLDEMLR